jgi:hypothetical protein
MTTKKSKRNAAKSKYKLTSREQAAVDKYFVRRAASPAPRLKVSNKEVAEPSHGNFQGDLAADRGTTAAATTRASVRRSIVMRSKATDGRSASNARQNGQMRPSTTVRAAPSHGSGLHLASVLQEGRKDANVFASSGVIWRILDRGIAPSLLAQDQRTERAAINVWDDPRQGRC